MAQDTVLDARSDPDGPLRRHDVAGASRQYRQYTGADMDELSTAMRMPGYPYATMPLRKHEHRSRSAIGVD
ncbi:hypothetical protein NS383_13125 [Pseudomonas oryzihabitans]|nr:hypothetical protein NS383_13125 [Pseudomonas psychrotolerans]